ncbi:MAG TPA: hypothetical protein VHN14_18140, partial [Kofleriaceae bacterium]|nr:hypothetical protein [Kofleriaceae bacterium]
YKRLDAGAFRIPEPVVSGDAACLINEREFEDLLAGIDLDPTGTVRLAELEATVVAQQVALEAERERRVAAEAERDRLREAYEALKILHRIPATGITRSPAGLVLCLCKGRAAGVLGRSTITSTSLRCSRTPRHHVRRSNRRSCVRLPLVAPEDC